MLRHDIICRPGLANSFSQASEQSFWKVCVCLSHLQKPILIMLQHSANLSLVCSAAKLDSTQSASFWMPWCRACEHVKRHWR